MLLQDLTIGELREIWIEENNQLAKARYEGVPWYLLTDKIDKIRQCSMLINLKSAVEKSQHYKPRQE